jgi:RNA polymerase sigma-70 factor (ECF subfamily)
MPDDQVRLIRQAQRGDAEACAVLYDRHYNAVYRYCYYRVSDAELAQDLASEVFVRMVEKLHTFKMRGRPLLAWLYTIARNLITDLHRRNSRTNALPLEEADTLVDDNEDVARRAEHRLQSDCLAAAMQHLTEEQRQVVLLKFMEGLSNAQAGRVLRKSEGAIKSLQHRALKALRRGLERERCYEA